LFELDILESLHQKFIETFSVSLMQSSKFSIFDGMLKVLQYTKLNTGKAVAITSTTSAIVELVLKTSGLENFFDVIVTSDMVQKAKPDPEAILFACELLGVLPDTNIIYVGDSIHDINAAESAGCTAIGVTWGAHRSQLKSAGRIHVDTPGELLVYLQKIIKKTQLPFLDLLEDNEIYFSKLMNSQEDLPWYSQGPMESSPRFERPIDLFKHSLSPILTRIDLATPEYIPPTIWLRKGIVIPDDLLHSDIVKAYSDLIAFLKDIKLETWWSLNTEFTTKWRKSISHAILHIGQVITSLKLVEMV